MEFLHYPLALIFTLGILVTIHELGHFIVARWSGVTVTRFSVGFGRPLFGRTDRHGTEFVVALIPLGGYVRMLDERELLPGAELPPDAVPYGALTPAWRMAIAVAGPLANFRLAVFVYWVLAVGGFTRCAPLLGEVDPESPLGRAGATAGLEIRAIDGAETPSWQQVSVALANRLGETGEIALELQRRGGASRQLVRLPISDWHRGESEPQLLQSLGINPRAPAVVGLVVPESPAAAAGFRVGDRILSIDGDAVAGWTDWVERVQRAPGQMLPLTLDRNGQQLELSVVPATRTTTTAEGEVTSGYLGIGMSLNEVRYGPIGAIARAVDETVSKTVMTLGLIRKMIFGQVSVQNLSGPFTIAEVAGTSARLGYTYFLGVLGLLSVSLGVLNLLPIPILDGGHIVWAAVEWIRGRPVPEAVQLLGAQIGLVLVGSLMALALFNDVARMLQ
ncbi:MAG: RIP metalloprotease RseP [Pseudomonadota bacterium]